MVKPISPPLVFEAVEITEVFFTVLQIDLVPFKIITLAKEEQNVVNLTPPFRIVVATRTLPYDFISEIFNPENPIQNDF